MSASQQAKAKRRQMRNGYAHLPARKRPTGKRPQGVQATASKQKK